MSGVLRAPSCDSGSVGSSLGKGSWNQDHVSRKLSGKGDLVVRGT